eukprot:740695_1
MIILNCQPQALCALYISNKLCYFYFLKMVLHHWESELMTSETGKPTVLHEETLTLISIVDYLGKITADSNNDMYGTTYVIDFEDLNAHSDDITEPIIQPLHRTLLRIDRWIEQPIDLPDHHPNNPHHHQRLRILFT